MNIGIDIDDTITNSSDIFVKYAKIYNKIHNIDHSINTDELDQSKAFGWTQKNQKEFALQYLKIILQEALPKENVIEAIKKLKELGCNIIFITARKDIEVDGMYALTKQWLDDNNIEFDKLVVNCDNKLQECINNNIKLFIDDNYFTCKQVHDSKKIEVLLYKTNYNKNYKNLEFEIVESWNEIIEKVRRKL